MKTLLLTAMILVFSIGFSFGQTNKSLSSQKKSESTEIKSVDEEGDVSSDGYMGYKDQILLRLVEKEMPQNFPTPKMGQSREDYKKTMLRWFKKNLNMVEEKYHSNLK